MSPKTGDYTTQIKHLFKGGLLKKYPKNQIIQYQGDKLSHVYLINKGYVKNYTILDSGDMRTLFILGPGDIFPIVFSATDDWRDYSLQYFYQSLTDVELQTLTAEEFMKAINSDPAKKETYVTFVSSVNESTMDQLAAMKQKSAISRIIHMMPFLISKMGQKIGPALYELRVKMTHQELADLSGMTRETTTTLVKRLEKEGVIKQHKGMLIIDEKKLETLREQEG